MRDEFKKYRKDRVNRKEVPWGEKDRRPQIKYVAKETHLHTYGGTTISFYQIHRGFNRWAVEVVYDNPGNINSPPFRDTHYENFYSRGLLKKFMLMHTFRFKRAGATTDPRELEDFDESKIYKGFNDKTDKNDKTKKSKLTNKTK